MTKTIHKTFINELLLEKIIFYTALSVLVLVPITFSTKVHRIFTLPRFILLIISSSVLTVCLSLRFTSANKKFFDNLLPTFLQVKHLVIAFSFLTLIFISTVFGVSPIASFLGSFENQMGFVTHLCFLIIFVSLIVGIGKDQVRFKQCLSLIAITGIIISIYAIVQFFGSDLFLSASLYTIDAPEGKIIRVISSLGHSNYLGNFLLYTTLVSASLALTSQGSTRRVFFAGTVISAVAIAISGTRGAWLGLLIGLASFFIYEIQPNLRLIFSEKKRRYSYIIVFSLILLVAIWIVSSNRYSNTLLARSRSTVSEGFTGSGRTLLWQDSLKMLSRYFFIGCGPEGFRRAFLPYKSKELAQLAPQINNESPHNAYLDAAISFGFIGGVLYILLLGSSLSLLYRARQILVNRKERILVSGLLSSFLAVAVHNFFIFDQLPTGLYFFAFAALAQTALHIAKCETISKEQTDDHLNTSPVPKALLSFQLIRQKVSPALSYLKWAMVVPCLCLLGLAVWYSIYLLRADVQLKNMTDAAYRGDIDKSYQQAVSFDYRADIDGSYGFAIARVLALSVDMLQAKLKSLPENTNQSQELFTARTKIIEVATKQTSRLANSSFTPDSRYLLLSYLTNLNEKYSESEFYARQTLQIDRYSANAYWLLASARLSQNDNEDAIDAAESALELNPSLSEARKVYRKAQGATRDGTAIELVDKALKLASKGKFAKAKKLLLRANRLADNNCSACQNALAKIENLERQQR